MHKLTEAFLSLNKNAREDSTSFLSVSITNDLFNHREANFTLVIFRKMASSDTTKTLSQGIVQAIYHCELVSGDSD